jgi:cytosine/uracil/thiamine/allantoin permease
MKILLRCLGFIGSWFVMSMLPFYGFAATGHINKSDLWGTVIIYITLLILMVLAFRLIRGAKKLNESAHQDKKEGAEWINHKLYDFNADQLDILIKEVNKLENDNQTKPTKN